MKLELSDGYLYNMQSLPEQNSENQILDDLGAKLFSTIPGAIPEKGVAGDFLSVVGEGVVA